MRINRIETKAYPISAEAENSALNYYKEKAKEVEKAYKSEVSIKLRHSYTPLVVLYAIKRDMDGMGTLIHGMENQFHVGLKDACFYILGHKGYGDAAKDAFVRSRDVQLERIDLLLKLATLSPNALQTLGFLLDHGTMNFMQLDIIKQNGAKELQGRKYADIFRPVDRESDLTKVFKEILEFKEVTPIYKVRPTLPLPRFTNSLYNISSNMRLTDTVEGEVELERIAHTPEKLIYIIETMFNCSLMVTRIVYLPYIECTFQWADKQSTELRYVPCLKTSEPRQFREPNKLNTITLGTKGHGLDSIPIEDVEINFSNVAGMLEVKEKIKEAIIYPIIHPELSEEFGSKAGGGILFYGPPGCGKTYIMRATVGEAGVNFYTVSTQDVVGDDVDAGAKRLDESFNEARAGAPSILFFDEIDALGGRRESAQKGSERRLVNQFLTNMEGVGSTNQSVLIVGSTNAPWGMDPALRRAGRFTTQILIPPPDHEARMQLLKLHTKGRPLADDIEFDKLADLTDNYSSADITAICDEAAKIPWSESVHGAEKRQIGMQDFLTVLDARESTLIPWLRLAEKQLRDSGEADVFPELADYVFKRAGGLEMVQQPKMSFKDVGGLEDVKEEIKNKVVYPLKHPELSEEYGREVGGGLLLYGPPGCGKTYIARATAGECGASFFNVKITDLMSPEEGVTEKRMHAIFERASRNTPAIIFFDEVDAVAGQRGSRKGGAERRLVNQFLTEMDGFERKEGVVVLAATNAPWDIDPALRRAGRFSDQIFVPPPDERSRQEIFHLHVGERPLADDVDYNELAKLTGDYSSADIKLICDEAAKIPWKESMESGERRPVSMADFKTAISLNKPTITPWFKQAEKQLRDSGEAELYKGLADYVFKRAGGLDEAAKSAITFADVGGLEVVKEEIQNKVVYPLRHPDLAQVYGRKVGGGMLLYGPPGCGKTYIARATAGEAKASFFNVKITDLMSPNEGETEKRLNAIFERASRNTPAIIFFDEVDAVAGQRGSRKGGAERRLVNQFLTEMDGFERKEGVVVLAATNAPWDIDPALRRAGRFSDQIFVPPPDDEGRHQIFRIHTRELPLADDVNFNELAKLTGDYSSADIKLICDEAAKIPWKESMESGERRSVSIADFKTVISQRKPSTKPWFKQVEKQLSESGEGDVYAELWNYIEGRSGKKGEMEGRILDELAVVKKEIAMLKDKLESGEIPEEVYNSLLTDYQKKLIQLETKLK